MKSRGKEEIFSEERPEHLHFARKRGFRLYLKSVENI